MLVVVCCSVAPVSADDAQLARRRALAQIQLAQAQRDEARQAAVSAHEADQPWRALLPLGVTLTGALVTALVAYLAVVAPLRTQREKDRDQQRDVAAEDAKHRQKEL
ncbi:MAG: hypothetical protein WBC33_11450, partial [Conexibacter sp.]